MKYVLNPMIYSSLPLSKFTIFRLYNVFAEDQQRINFSERCFA